MRRVRVAASLLAVLLAFAVVLVSARQGALEPGQTRTVDSFADLPENLVRPSELVLREPASASPAAASPAAAAQQADQNAPSVTAATGPAEMPATPLKAKQNGTTVPPQDTTGLGFGALSSDKPQLINQQVRVDFIFPPLPNDAAGKAGTGMGGPDGAGDDDDDDDDSNGDGDGMPSTAPEDTTGDMGAGEIAHGAKNKLARQLFDETNEYRASQNLPALKWDPVLGSLATAHSRDMSTGAVGFSHDGFDDRMETAHERGLGWVKSGENIGYHTGGVDNITQMWIKSEGHRKNLVGDFTHLGVGVFKASGSRKYFATQLFAKVNPEK